VTIADSVFDSNTAVSVGVMYSVLANRTLISNTKFTSNDASTDVGVLALTNQTLIEGCEFTKNTAVKKAVFQIDTKSDIEIHNTLFQSNTAEKSVCLGSVSDSGKFIVT
jgi:hypothetical protein